MKDKMLIHISYFALLYLLSTVKGTNYHVPLDYNQIQSAIDASSLTGDTIIVAPGRYIENIEYNGKNIYLVSHYFYTGHDSTIQQTIIDGNQNGSVVTFFGGEDRSAVLNGFTVTNGSGTSPSPVSSGHSGAGIIVKDSAPTIINCIIQENQTWGVGAGGGILFNNSTAYLSNLIITANHGYMGGGIYMTSSDVEMDSINRCSVFLNEALEFNDIYNNKYHINQAEPAIYLDTASVDSIDDYFIDGNFEVVDILNAKIEKVPHDLFVSPDGNDDNSGLTPDDPLKTITYALHIIHADSLHPRTINLISGQISPAVFSRSLGQVFPLNLRSYVSIIGQGPEQTVFDLEGTVLTVMGGYNYEKYITLSSMSIINGANVFPPEIPSGFSIPIPFVQPIGLILENMKFENNSVNVVEITLYTPFSLLNNSSILFNNCSVVNQSDGSIYLRELSDIQVTNCVFFNHGQNYFEYPAFAIGGYNHEYNSSYIRKIENCTFGHNVDLYDEFPPSATDLLIYNVAYPIDIINCTFANGYSPFGSSVKIDSEITSRNGLNTNVRFINCVLWNDETSMEIFHFENYQNENLTRLIMAYNNIQDSYWSIVRYGYIDLIYDESNIEDLPLFTNPDNLDYTLQPNSPCIDAGTAFYVYEGDTIVNLSPDEYYGSAPDIGAHEWRPTVGIDDNLLILPGNVAISSVYPNPFNSSTTVKYQVPNSGKINLSIYDITGRLVKELIDTYVRMGEHSLTMNVSDLASGMYILRLKTKTGSSSRQIALIK